jgi:hypothetical protein
MESGEIADSPMNCTDPLLVETGELRPLAEELISLKVQKHR